jgi:hypothetical protein
MFSYAPSSLLMSLLMYFLATADTRTLVPDQPVIPIESRYSLRTRNAKQLNPYVYDQLLYKKQMQAIPDAIVKVVSPIKHYSHVGRAAQEMFEQLPDIPLSRPKKRKSITHALTESDQSELSDSRRSIASVEHRPRRKRPSYRVPKLPRPFPFRDHDLARSESPPAVVVRVSRCCRCCLFTIACFFLVCSVFYTVRRWHPGLFERRRFPSDNTHLPQVRFTHDSGSHVRFRQFQHTASR